MQFEQDLKNRIEGCGRPVDGSITDLHIIFRRRSIAIFSELVCCYRQSPNPDNYNLNIRDSKGVVP